MASLYTLYKTVTNALVGYAEVDLGADSSGNARRMPRSVPSDETATALFTTGNPGHVTLDNNAVTIGTEIEIKNDTGSPIPTSPQANAPRKAATGSLAANNAALSLALDGMSTAVVQLTGTWGGTVSFFASVDGGTTYFPVNMIPYAGGAAVGSTTANGIWEMATGGLTHIQVIMTPFTSGSASVLLVGASGVKSIRVGAPAANPVPILRSPLTYTVAFSGALASGWAKVATTTTATKGLRIAPIGSANAYDIEWTVVAAGAAPPTDTYGEAIGGGEDFAAGLPIGDIYLRSTTSQVAVVKTGA